MMGILGGTMLCLQDVYHLLPAFQQSANSALLVLVKKMGPPIATFKWPLGEAITLG